jgi:hypothetical protein
MTFPSDPKEGQTYQVPALTQPQREALKQAAKRTKARKPKT